MTSREDLIKEAAEAMYRLTNSLSMSGARDLARAALAVFEQAHTSNDHHVDHHDDDREALRREFEYRIRTGWALAHAYEKGTITARRKKELIRDEIDGAMASLTVAGFFRRIAQIDDGHDGWCGCEKCEPGDEREALADAFDEMHQITEGGCDTRGEDVADMVLGLGFCRTVQGEPSLPPRFSQVTETMIRNFKTGWHQADMEGDAGNRVKRGLEAVLDAQREQGEPTAFEKRHADHEHVGPYCMPQGEPTDAAVLAALNEYEAWSAEETLDMWGSDQAERMRRALRAAAAAVREEGQGPDRTTNHEIRRD